MPQIRDAGGCPHAAQKAVPLDEENLVACAASHRRGDETGRPASEHDHIVFAEHRRVSWRLGDKRGHFASLGVESCRYPCTVAPTCSTQSSYTLGANSSSILK
jgi:hypothetical protein